MSDHVYRKIEVVGSSKNSIEDAIQGAVSRASENLRNLEWFEVKEIRGEVVDGNQVGFYQVVMQVGFRLE